MPRRGPDPGVGVLKIVDRAGLRVDAADFLGAHHQEVAVVLRVRNHVVDVGARNLVRLEHLELAGLDVEPQDGVGARILQPHLAVDVVPIGADLVDLHVIAVQLRRQAPRLELLRLLVELGDAALELHRQPQVLVLVEPHAEDARRRARLQQRDRDTR